MSSRNRRPFTLFFLGCFICAPSVASGQATDGEGDGVEEETFVLDLDDLDELETADENSPADEGEVLAPEVVVVGDIDDEEVPVEDETVSVERIRVDDQPAGTTLVQMLNDVAGVRMRRGGGLESFSTATVRGSTGAQVLVMQDGLSLGSASGLEVNISEIPVEFFEEVQVYRGPSAAHFGSGAIGGVINLVPRRPDQGVMTRLEISLGSYMPGHFDAERIFSFSAQRRITLHTLAGLGRLSILGSASYFDTEGDFVYLNDNGTRLETGDDSYLERTNNDASQWNVMLNGIVDLDGDYELRFNETASTRTQGIPGYGAVLASIARTRTTKNLTSVELARRGGPGRSDAMRANLSLRLRREEWFDPSGEVGMGNNHNDDLIVDVRGQVRGGWLLPRTRGTAWVLGELRYEEFFARRLVIDERWGWRRFTGSLSSWASWPLAGGVVELAPQARVDISHDRPVGSGPLVPGVEQLEPDTKLVSSEQFGLRVHPTEWLTIRSYGGLTQRMPSFLELFGDRGTVVSNPQLRPESGWAVDLGVLISGEDVGFLESARLEVTGFYRHVNDLIQLVPNSQVTFVAINLGSARIAGAEATGQLSADWTQSFESRWRGFIRLRSALTFLHAIDTSGTYSDGNVLPLRPRWEVFSRLSFSYGPFELAYELEFMARNYLDLANHREVPNRLFHSLELSADLGRWGAPLITILARNLTNNITQDLPVQAEPDPIIVERPVSDVMGYPLPGFTLMLTLRWDLGSLAARHRLERRAAAGAEGLER